MDSLQINYFNMRFFAEKSGYAVQTPAWIGQNLFGHNESLPFANFTRITEQQICGDIDLISNEFVKSDLHPQIDFEGYFQLTKFYNSNIQFFRNLFVPEPNLSGWLQEKCACLKAKNIIAVHMRYGDYGYGYFYQTKPTWVLEWLEREWHTFDNPVLYVASDEATRALKHFKSYEPISAKDLGMSLPGAQFYPDFWMLSQAHSLAIANSSFSFAAAMLNEVSQNFVRPSLKANGMIPFDARRDPVLLRESNYWLTVMTKLPKTRRLVGKIRRVLET